jgi:predicted small metal-binding protein
MPMKMAECECGFMIRSPMENEMADMLMMHSKNTHKMDMPRMDAMKMLKPAQM